MLLIFLVTLVIALLAQWHVKRAYARHSRTPTASGYTGAEVAEQILRQAGITNIDIHAEARDHTLEAAWLKVTISLRKQIEQRKRRQEARLKSNRQLPGAASRLTRSVVGLRA